ncbi:MAG TPA: hypothetical protein VLO07_10280 [Thermoanaerobaculia bacterium]|nr:hypothetical protein [Thermoanaerobaculia bacterium]
MRLWKKILLIAGLLVAAVVTYGVTSFGPRNIVGMLRYDQRKEGNLKVGDRPPDVELVAVDGQKRVRLAASVGHEPLVLVFGSFT